MLVPLACLIVAACAAAFGFAVGGALGYGLVCGGLLGAAHHGGLIFSDASNTPKVAEGLISLTPRRLAHLIMPELARQSASTAQPPNAPQRHKQNA